MKQLSEKRIALAKVRFFSLGCITSRSQFGGYGLLSNEIMFAVISDGELYLRANNHIENRFQARGMTNLVYSKRGIPVSLRYYWVDESLWNDNETLLDFARLALDGARAEAASKRHEAVRLKDLPNLGVGLERLLWKVGIKSAYDLRVEGAKCSYLKLRALKESLGVHVLLALAGAISGYHHAVLPNRIRSELLEWFEGIRSPATKCL